MSIDTTSNNLLPSINYKQIISLVVLLLVLVTLPTHSASTASYECPVDCTCDFSKFSAKCSNITTLLNSYNQKHAQKNLMPIKSLDLSNNKLTKITHQLELLADLTELNLSHNQLTQVNKLNLEFLEKLDLSHNRITSGKLSKLPRHIVNLDLSSNEITYLPIDFMKMKKLRTLELNDNPLNCTCDTLMVRNWMSFQHVWSSHVVKCTSPQIVKGQPWLQARQNDICIEASSTTTQRSKYNWDLYEDNELMMADQPADDDSENDKNDMGATYDDDYTDGEEEKKDEEPKDEEPKDEEPKDEEPKSEEEEKKVEAVETNTNDDDDDKKNDDELNQDFIPVNNNEDHHNHNNHHEESSSIAPENGDVDYDVEGSGDDHSVAPENMTTNLEEEDGSGESSGAGIILPGPNDDDAAVVLQNAKLPSNAEAENIATGESKIVDPNASAKQTEKASVVEDNTGTYILLAIIGILLVSLIIFVAMKNRKEKRQKKRMYDVEKNGATELQDMDKRLLGKPIEKNGNGKHENAPLMNKFTDDDDQKFPRMPEITIDEPVQEVPLKETEKSQQSLYDNTPNGNGNVHGNGNVPKSPDSDDEVFHPATDNPIDPEILNVEQPEQPKRYSPIYSPASPRSARYSPVYSPETGRVKIKLTETPKPKTPVVVTRSRSRAGDYINTPEN